MARAKEAKQPSYGIVRLDELPEYREVVGWSVKVRADAEEKIASMSVWVPPKVLAWLDELLEIGVLTGRERDLVTLWDGVGAAASEGAVSANYYTLREILKSIACLPGSGDDRKAWWREQVEKPEDGEQKVNFNTMKSRHYICRFESDTALEEVLRKCLRTLLCEIPTAVEIGEMLQPRGVEPVDGAKRLMKLSGIATRVKTLRHYESLVLHSSYGPALSTGDWSASKVAADLREAELEFIEDCGRIASAEVVRNAIAQFGAGVRGCAACDNWFVVKDARYSFPSQCPGCGEVSFALDRTAVGPVHRRRDGEAGLPLTYEDHLLRHLRSRVEETSDLAVKVAVAVGTTVNHARQQLAGGDISVEDATAGLEICPVAASCHSLCGSLQARGERSIPLAPFSGRYKECHNYGFRSMVDGMNGVKQRDGIAKQWAEQIWAIAKEDQPHVAAERALEDIEAGVVSFIPAVEADSTIGMQSAMF